MPKYRMYIDEVGNAQPCKHPNDENARYLSLTGVIIALDYSRDSLHPQLEGLKRNYFHSHPDDPVIFHRKHLVQGNQPFQSLRDQGTREAFFYEFFELISQAEYQVVTAVVDKIALQEKHGNNAWEPYHFALEILLERYVRFLSLRPDSLGDLMVESRNSGQDRDLKLSFARLCNKGTYYCSSQDIEKAITSKEIKIRPKTSNIAGLQLADLLAHPSAISIIRENTRQPWIHEYGNRVVEILNRDKYRRDGNTIKGIGRKLVR